MKQCLLLILLNVVGMSFVVSSENTFNISLGTGISYYEVITTGNSESKAYVTNMLAKINADWSFMDRFFLCATGNFPIVKESDNETFYHQNNLIQANTFKFSEKNLEIYGGFKMISLLNPFVGFALSELKLERSNIHSVNMDSEYNSKVFNAYDFLLGLKGTYIFNDYTSLGYLMTYQSSPVSDADYQNVDYENVDTSRVFSEVFLKYWLPNELFEIGLHVYGGRYLYDSKVAASNLLPDTDIRYIGAFLSFKINL